MVLHPSPTPSPSLHIQVERLRGEAADTRLQTEWLEGALADRQEAGGRAPSSALVLEQQRVAQVWSWVGEGRTVFRAPRKRPSPSCDNNACLCISPPGSEC